MKRRSSALSDSATLSVEERTAVVKAKVQQLREDNAALARSAAALCLDYVDSMNEWD